MITEKNNVFYCDCGFSFQRGRSGSHDCADGLRNKLAEYEVRYAALAAENEGLKAANAEGCKWDGEQWVGISIETPATDAFLAEVRAQGVEMFAQKCDLKASQALSSDISENWKLLGEHASDFATELRKGVQS
ncbi:hypothetical protein [Enterobacter cloacae]|uniref:hypothetical protein n=1 Tax=Enterobacter cloacae TaxID=550 RepID=UPI0028751DFB|nr:hypothetical protein [Enterobacter cloacae]MDS0062831.1 hypothetical protein [Enterobacter cloacae subsp. cloacae]MDS0105881.1 hypothetical protein [Enterobacter cloacae subsp. cloacae]MDW8494074.1 hypothetical protein [Enterobacter cloacae subsp. cloacae]